jgi:predicted HTH domain antitoxin
MWRNDRKPAGRCRQALEVLAVEGYRSGASTHHEASRLPQLSRLEFEALLKRCHADDHAYDIEDLRQDLETLDRPEPGGMTRRS